MSLRAELDLQAPVTATLRHGDRIDILETRRRFVRARAPDGAVGWTDSAYLLTQAQIDDLKTLENRAASIPSQGIATVYDALNVHTAASRSAPSILQLQEGDKIEVVAHRVTPRTPAVTGAKSVVRKELKDPPSEELASAPDLPPASPPPLPPNWEQLSRPRLEDLADAPAALHGPLPADDWFLVRTAEGRAGWVLMRMVLMLVPDEVAQYAERHLITSYHALGEATSSKGEQKRHWLWTTTAKGLQPYDFDSFRVFVYSLRRERYETVAIERNLKGYFPVETLVTPEGAAFSFLVEDKDGQIRKRTYLFKDQRARLLSKVPASLPEPLPEVRAAKGFDAVPTDEGGWVKKLAKKWFGE